MKLICNHCSCRFEANDADGTAAGISCPRCNNTVSRDDAAVRHPPADANVATVHSSAIRTERRFVAELAFRFLSGPQEGTVRQVRANRIVIGRGDQADLNVEDPGVSRKHAALEVLSKNNVFLTDLSSANGTQLNGRKISRSRLLDNDEIQIGVTRIRIEV